MAGTGENHQFRDRLKLAASGWSICFSLLQAKEDKQFGLLVLAVTEEEQGYFKMHDHL